VSARRIVIVGGGFSGASAAVQLARNIAQPLEIAIVEPAEEVGPGLAYSTGDPVFRLNAVAGAHSIDPADPGHFNSWCDAQGLRDSDPDAYAPCGQPFARRRDYGRYLAETVREHAEMPNGTTIAHRRAQAQEIEIRAESMTVTLEDGRALAADNVILATGNPAPRVPAMLAGELAGHPAVRANPLAEGMGGIAQGARVLVVGAGLTALDMVASLIERGHTGPVSVISRRGLRPRPQPPAILSPPPDPPPPPVIPLELLNGELPGYAQTEPLTARGLLRGLRAAIRETEAAGEPWQSAFDAIALPLSRIWPRLADEEKRRLLRHARAFYDAFRFRTPPMTEAIVRAAENTGQVEYRTAALAGAAPAADGGIEVRLRLTGGEYATERFDVLVNCTGLDQAGAAERHPLLKRLVDLGHLTPHPTGLGIVTDAECRAVASDGRVEPRLRVIGPPTAGMFGDPLGVFFISAQIHRIVPSLAEELAEITLPAS
jgi:uncharacterized NAD(P)/FAD-binding protein YdhS